MLRISKVRKETYPSGFKPDRTAFFTHPHPYLLILCTVLFSACQIPINNWFTARGDILFADDFSNTTSGWPHLTDHNGTMDYFGGTYRIVVMVPKYDLWTTSGHEYSDAHLEVDAGPLGGPPENRYGLIRRHRDATILPYAA